MAGVTGVCRAVLLLACAIGLGAAAAQERAFQAASKAKSKLREGVKLTDRGGAIVARGERLLFTPEGESDSLTLLENQTLERVASALSNQTTRMQWTISGVVTEFNGGQYLLLERAVLKPVRSGPVGAE